MEHSPQSHAQGGVHLPQAVWLALFFLLLGMVVALWMTHSREAPPKSNFGKILQIYSFKPEVNTTVYESKAGNATVIWMSGMDESFTQGPIWQVYSYSPEVSATAYESKAGNATVIWMSGMDNERQRLPPKGKHP